MKKIIAFSNPLTETTLPEHVDILMNTAFQNGYNQGIGQEFQSIYRER